MMPETDEGEIRVNVELAAGTRIEVTDELTRKLETIVRREIPEMRSMLTKVGGGGWMSSSTHTSELRIMLVTHEQRQQIEF
jgi:HAE1 family hydrophobic/amphiphilic exporter-1